MRALATLQARGSDLRVCEEMCETSCCSAATTLSMLSRDQSLHHQCSHASPVGNDHETCDGLSIRNQNSVPFPSRPEVHLFERTSLSFHAKKRGKLHMFYHSFNRHQEKAGESSPFWELRARGLRGGRRCLGGHRSATRRGVRLHGLGRGVPLKRALERGADVAHRQLLRRAAAVATRNLST